MTSYHFPFEKLKVWTLSRTLVNSIYQQTSRFPSEEKFGLASQIRRAAISVMSNIAEGSTRMGGKDQARFSELAYSSLNELLAQLIISKDLGYLSDQEFENLQINLSEIAKMLISLRRFQLKK